MKRLFTVLCVMVLLGAGAALAQDVRYNFSKDADFSKYKTYKWVPIKDAAKVSDLLEPSEIAHVKVVQRHIAPIGSTGKRTIDDLQGGPFIGKDTKLVLAALRRCEFQSDAISKVGARKRLLA